MGPKRAPWLYFTIGDNVVSIYFSHLLAVALLVCAVLAIVFLIHRLERCCALSFSFLQVTAVPVTCISPFPFFQQTPARVSYRLRRDGLRLAIFCHPSLSWCRVASKMDGSFHLDPGRRTAIRTKPSPTRSVSFMRVLGIIQTPSTARGAKLKLALTPTIGRGTTYFISLTILCSQHDAGVNTWISEQNFFHRCQHGLKRLCPAPQRARQVIFFPSHLPLVSSPPTTC